MIMITARGDARNEAPGAGTDETLLTKPIDPGRSAVGLICALYAPHNLPKICCRRQLLLGPQRHFVAQLTHCERFIRSPHRLAPAAMAAR